MGAKIFCNESAKKILQRDEWKCGVVCKSWSWGGYKSVITYRREETTTGISFLKHTAVMWADSSSFVVSQNLFAVWSNNREWRKMPIILHAVKLMINTNENIKKKLSKVYERLYVKMEVHPWWINSQLWCVFLQNNSLSLFCVRLPC
jgi:hypothetical protein